MTQPRSPRPTAMKRCPVIHRILGEIAAGTLSAEISRHLDACERCATRVEMAHRHASAVLTPRLVVDCDDALMLIALPDEVGASDHELAGLLVHLVECESCQAVCVGVSAGDLASQLASQLDSQLDTRPEHPPGTAADIPAPRGADTPLDDFLRLPRIPRETFVLGQELGRGGMGRVVEARDRRLGRRLVIKEPLVEDGQTWSQRRALYTRLEREARVTARLDHPAIVAVHEAGRWPSGEPFYAMRHVSGEPLDEAIARARTLEDRIALLPHVIAAADAIAYAHTQRIIHRDIKPQNILVGEFGETVVIDWGLAKNLAHAPASASAHARASAPGDALVNDRAADARTADSRSDVSWFPVTWLRGGDALMTAGGAVGTPAYMPPEQADGEMVDERADVHALGAILYHLIAGRAPYSDHRGSTHVLRRVARTPPTALHRLAPGAPPALMSIAARAMARERDARFANASELAGELRQFQRGQLVHTHQYTVRELLVHTVRKHRGVVIASTLLLLALLITGVVSVRQIARQVERAEASAALARRESQMAGEARKKAQEAQEKAQDEAETARREQARAEAATRETSAALGIAQQARSESERARARAELAQRRAELARQRAEDARRERESALREAEAARQVAQLQTARAEMEARRARREKASADRAAARDRARLKRAIHTFGILVEDLQ